MNVCKYACPSLDLNDLRAALVDANAELVGIDAAGESITLYFVTEDGNADALRLTACPDAVEGATLNVMYFPADTENAAESASEGADD